MLVYSALVAAILIAESPSAEIIFSDDFDSGRPSWGWSGVSASVVIASDNPHGGEGFSARGVYRNVEDTNCLTVSPAREDYYLRYYIYYGRGMEYWRCKIMRLGYWSETESYYVNVGWTCFDGVNDDGIHFTSRSTEYEGPRNYFFNFPHVRNHADAQWLCFEFHIKLNTPGLSDGMLEAWINGAPAFSRGGLNIRGRIDDKPEYHWIFGNYSNGLPGTPIPGAPYYVWIDDVVYATERVYPLEDAGHPPPLDPTPTPAPPEPDLGLLWQDGFESGDTSAWVDVWNARVINDPENVHSGRYAAEFRYDPGVEAAGWLWKKSLPTEGHPAVFFRWYQKWEEGWTWCPNGPQQNLKVYSLSSPSDWAPAAKWGIGLHEDQGAPVPELTGYLPEVSWEFSQNIGAPVDIPENEWVEIEIGLLPNTPGEENGAVALWLNGKPVAFYEDISVRSVDVPPNAIMVNCWYPGGSDHVQRTWVDDFAVAAKRIGQGAQSASIPSNVEDALWSQYE
jgi:hypothetical protein